MKTLPDYLKLQNYGISPEDVTRMVFNYPPNAIHPDVILMPWWQPEVFSLWVDQITTVTKDVLYEISFEGKLISVVRSGVGAPPTGDTVLVLGCTPCERIWFTGSVGALRADIKIGDLMIPEFSYCGDGFSRYLEGKFPPRDCLFERANPDHELSLAISRSSALLAREYGVAVHTGPVYSIDSILTQFSILDSLTNVLDCIGIEMETAAVFNAARTVGIRAAALLSVSDVPIEGKSLFSGRSKEEKDHRKEIRSKVLARALLDCIV